MAELAVDLSYEADLGGPAEHSGEGASVPSPIFSVSLPIPTSVNRMFVNHGKKGRRRSKEYNAWRKEAGWRILVAKERHKIAVPSMHDFGLIIEIDRPSRKRDLDNCMKALIDSLVTGGVVHDDNQLAFFMACWRPKQKRCWANIHLFEAEKSPLVAFVPRTLGYGASGTFMLN